MLSASQEKGRRCEDFFEPILKSLCPTRLEHVTKGADHKCGNVYFEIKTCRGGLTKKQRATKDQVEKSGGKYLILRCPCGQELKRKAKAWRRRG